MPSFNQMQPVSEEFLAYQFHNLDPNTTYRVSASLDPGFPPDKTLSTLFATPPDLNAATFDLASGNTHPLGLDVTNFGIIVANRNPQNSTTHQTHLYVYDATGAHIATHGPILLPNGTNPWPLGDIVWAADRSELYMVFFANGASSSQFYGYLSFASDGTLESTTLTESTLPLNGGPHFASGNPSTRQTIGYYNNALYDGFGNENTFSLKFGSSGNAYFFNKFNTATQATKVRQDVAPFDPGVLTGDSDLFTFVLERARSLAISQDEQRVLILNPPTAKVHAFNLSGNQVTTEPEPPRLISINIGGRQIIVGNRTGPFDVLVYREVQDMFHTPHVTASAVANDPTATVEITPIRKTFQAHFPGFHVGQTYTQQFSFVVSSFYGSQTYIVNYTIELIPVFRLPEEQAPDPTDPTTPSVPEEPEPIPGEPPTVIASASPNNAQQGDSVFLSVTIASDTELTTSTIQLTSQPSEADENTDLENITSPYNRTISFDTVGAYQWTVIATNEDGTTTETIDLTVTEAEVMLPSVRIDSFTADSYLINQGDRPSLDWNTTSPEDGDTRLFLNGVREHAFDAVNFRPAAISADTEYTLRIEHGTGADLVSDEDSLTVRVVAPDEMTAPERKPDAPEPEPDDPDPLGPPNVSLTALPSSLPVGTSGTVTWSVIGTNIKRVTLNGQQVANIGSRTVTPDTTTRYRLVVTYDRGPLYQDGEIARTRTISVVKTAPNPTGTFTISDDEILAGDSVVLRWALLHTSSRSISSIGNVASAGSITVTPTLSGTYILTAIGTNGQVLRLSVTVIVNPRPAFTFFDFGNVRSDGTALLTWRASAPSGAQVNIAGPNNYSLTNQLLAGFTSIAIPGNVERYGPFVAHIEYEERKFAYTAATALQDLGTLTQISGYWFIRDKNNLLYRVSSFSGVAPTEGQKIQFDIVNNSWFTSLVNGLGSSAYAYALASGLATGLTSAAATATALIAQQAILATANSVLAATGQATVATFTKLGSTYVAAWTASHISLATATAAAIARFAASASLVGNVLFLPGESPGFEDFNYGGVRATCSILASVGALTNTTSIPSGSGDFNLTAGFSFVHPAAYPGSTQGNVFGRSINQGYLVVDGNLKLRVSPSDGRYLRDGITAGINLFNNLPSNLFTKEAANLRP